MLKYMFILAILLAATYTDIKKYIIPDKLTYSGFIVAGVYNIYLLFNNRHLFLNNIYGFLAMFVGLLLLSLIPFHGESGIGGGDIKMYSLLGLFLGLNNIIFIFFASSIIGGIISLVLLIIRRKKGTDPVPMMPFITLSYILWLYLVI